MKHPYVPFPYQQEYIDRILKLASADIPIKVMISTPRRHDVNPFYQLYLEQQMQDYLLQFFAYEHLPAHLQAVSKPFNDLAVDLLNALPSNPERTTALRKLLEAKDCAVRALLFK